VGHHTLHALHTDAENWYTGAEMVATSWSHSLTHAEESVGNNVFNKDRDNVQEKNKRTCISLLWSPTIGGT
jgi:hypothetical protein